MWKMWWPGALEAADDVQVACLWAQQELEQHEEEVIDSVWTFNGPELLDEYLTQAYSIMFPPEVEKVQTFPLCACSAFQKACAVPCVLEHVVCDVTKGT